MGSVAEIRGERTGVPVLDRSTLSGVAIEYEHHEVHEGDSWKAFVVETDFDKSDSISLCFTTPRISKWIHAIFEYACGTNVTVSLLEGVSVTAATGESRIPSCRNRNLMHKSGIFDPLTGLANRYRVNATITGGELLCQDVLGAARAGGGAIIGGRSIFEWVLAENTIYAVRMVGFGVGVDNSIGSIGMTWYEHSDIA